MGLVYTPDQQAAIDRLVSFCLSEKKGGRILLKGHAGTGKSTIIQEVIRQVGRSKVICLTAPTNKATKVLNDMAYKYSVPVADVRTIYSLLGLVLKPDGSVKTVQHTGGSDMESSADVVVVDEASMLNSNVYRYILSSVDMYGYKLIFIGDRLQLPPVGEEDSPVFLDDGIEVIELTSTVRQAEGSPIIELANVLRQAIIADDKNSVIKWINDHPRIKTQDSGSLHLLKKKQFKEWMKAGYVSEKYAEDNDFIRGVAWRNVTVDSMNEFARVALYGDPPPHPFALHENVLSADIVKEWHLRASLKEDGEIMMKVDDEGSVISVTELERHPMLPKAFSEISVHEISLATAKGMVKAYMPRGEGKKIYNKTLNRLQKEAKAERHLWANFWGYKESFNDIRPAHALTSHRSQGSTYKNVFVDVGDIFRNRDTVESLKSLYVSATRASENLFLTGV